MVRDDIESGIVTSYKNKGIIIPELISLPFFLRSSNICLKKLFFRQTFLKNIYYHHAKFLKTRNLHLLWLQTKLCLILATPWLPVYKRFLLQHYINYFVYDRQCIIIMLILTYVVYDSRRTLFDFWEQTCSLNFAWFLCTEAHPSFVIRWWYHHSCCQWHKEDLSNSWIKDTRWKVMIILGYWTLHHFHTQTLHSLHLDWWYFLSLRQWLLADLHWFMGQNMTGKGQTYGSKSCNWRLCLRRIALFTTNTCQSYRHDRLSDVQDIHSRCIKLTKYTW